MPDSISIIVPIYNAFEYLERCIKSILNQTYKELQIILVNDGSTDSSAEICKKYQKQDKRIMVLHQENRGLVSARKTGLRAAKGAYIGFVDADDYIESDMFENLYSKATEFDVDFVHSGMIIDGIKNCNYEEGIIDFAKRDRADYINRNIFMTQTMSFPLWCKLFKADVVREAYMQLPEDQSYGEDLLCLCNCLLQSNKCYMLGEAFYHYQIYEGSLSHLNWLDTCMEESKLYSQVIKILKKHNLLSGCGDSVRNHYKKRMIQAMTDDQSSGISSLKYRFSDIEDLKGKKVVIYGAGMVGKSFYSQISRYDQCELVAWVDKSQYGNFNLISIEKPEILRKTEYDVILLAIKSKVVADEIKEELALEGICKNRNMILWKEPVTVW